MKKILLTVVLLVLLITTAYAEDKKECFGRYGLAFVDTDTLHKYVDIDCDGLWDVILEYTQSQGVYTFTGKHCTCPIEYRAVELTEVETK